jgi:hypothetical protein
MASPGILAEPRPTIILCVVPKRLIKGLFYNEE